MARKDKRARQRKKVEAKSGNELRETWSEKHVCSRTDLEGMRGWGRKRMRHVSIL